MARKKDIASLISGIVGASEPQTSTSEGVDLPKETVEALHITPEIEERLNAVRRANVGRGRPKKYSEEERIERNFRATFVVSRETIRKVKYISLMDSKLLKDVIDEALGEYIAKWERKNGDINLPR